MSRGSAIIVAAVLIAGCHESTSEVTVQTVSGRTGAPVAGIRVQVEDQSWLETDSAGAARFTVTSPTFTVRIRETYDCVQTTESITVLLEQRGPTVVYPVFSRTSCNNADSKWYDGTFSGAVTGLTGASSAAAWVQQTWGGGGVGPVYLEAGSTSFTIGAYVEAPAANTVTLRAFEADIGSNTISPRVSHVYAMGSTQVTVTPGCSLTGVVIPLSPVTERSITGTATVDPALAGSKVSAGWYWATAEGVPLQDPGAWINPPAAFTVTAPQVTEGTVWFTVDAAAPGFPAGDRGGVHHTRVATSSSSLAFRLPAPVAPVEPASGASFDHATRFSWTPPEAGGVSEFDLLCSIDGPPMRSLYFSVTTPGTSTTVPEVADMPVPSGTVCTWRVTWFAATDREVESRWSDVAGEWPVVAL